MLQVRRNSPSRSANVEHKSNYRKYKPALREDFNCRCGYCDADDKYLGGARAFHIDHFAPWSLFPELKTSYENLVYSCPFCNGAKSNYWATQDSSISVSGNEGVLDPCCNQYDEHVTRTDSGYIEGVTELGKFMVDKLNLFFRRNALLWKLSVLEERIATLKKVDKANLSDDARSIYVELLENYFELRDYVCENVND